MNENEYIARIARQQLEQNLPVVLVAITSLEGSAPRQSGTKMLVGGDGKSYGSIGGSIIEAASIKKAMGIFTTAQPVMLKFELSGQDTAAPGMICGGNTEVMLDYLPPTPENKAFVRAWHEAVNGSRDFYLLTRINNTGPTLEIPGHAILFNDGHVAGGSGITDADIAIVKPELHNISATTVIQHEDASMLVDRIRRVKTLFCFGAGHVAVPTAQLATMVGFRVVMIDDRDEYANTARFPEAAEIRVIRDFNHATDGLKIDADSFIVILTRGHQYDREVLEAALKTPAGYIGMISSRKKRQAVYDALIADGASREALEKVHSPIGLEIGGETPEEIAVSIVAELISVRSEQQT